MIPLRHNRPADPSEREKTEAPLRALGICLGATTLSMVALERLGDSARPHVTRWSVEPHAGNPKLALIRAVRKIDPDGFHRVAATGRKFRHMVNLTSLPEPEAVEHAYRHVRPPGVSCPAVVSAGGETFMAYALDGRGRIVNVMTGNKCASGTGEFLLQQLRRMDVTLEEAFRWAATEDPHPVSGRCSVFCKSDCTHATNKGVPKANVTAGLCKMMAEKILELLKKIPRRQIMITGGTARNRMMIEYLKQQIEDLVVPQEAAYFEALGAALWSLENETTPLPAIDALFKQEAAVFERLAPLSEFAPQVTFKTIERDFPRTGDVCILGLDVGSTTTKAVLIRSADNALLASIYLRTDGDPVGASRRCYQALWNQVAQRISPATLTVSGLGVCGSGRQIAGLHALTDGVINEIISHATAAVYFDPEVDTLFEIGGQDAKYTYITNGVPSDYAMNEACSAGTGSFLEEAALETLGVAMEEIAEVALQGRHPPNFNDQCAAFIASDVKNAIHEGVEHADIVAGLVYSICMNYTNRVKGNRPVGRKIFMQGGVCYNRAVPLAMAALVGQPIVVPPEPGLMGAFGVALAVRERITQGLLAPGRFDLQELAERRVSYGKSFTCRGGSEECDRRCQIATVRIGDNRYPFGGACNRYDNLRRNIRFDVKQFDRIRQRQQIIFAPPPVRALPKGAAPGGSGYRGRIGFNRSFLVNTYYPLYATFFAELGYEAVLADRPSRAGVDQRSAPFCYPAELAHGFFHRLISATDPPEYIFLPHFRAVPLLNGGSQSQVCPLVQGETFYLRTTFRRELETLATEGTLLLTPCIDMTRGIAGARDPLVAAARQMGAGRQEAVIAFDRALAVQEARLAELKRIGRQALAEIEDRPDRVGVVLLARPYNGFAEEAHMGIPGKFASRGIRVLPADALPLENEPAPEHMYWGMGQLLLMAARAIERHPQLFATYITNFSCGPDSLILGYFRTLMGRKPSLTLELDSHTADAGLETRIEAFLDVVCAYRQLVAEKRILPARRTFTSARTTDDRGRPAVVTSNGEVLPLTDPRVTVLFPSMGRLASEGITALFQSQGYRTRCHPPSGEAVLKLGRRHTSGKECLPLILTTGSLLNYIQHEKRTDEVLVYFMPTGSGPCRFGQYSIFMQDLMQRLEIPDVALFSLSSETSYAGLGNDIHLKGWWVVVISDVMEDVRAMILANAADTMAAMAVFEGAWQEILSRLRRFDEDRVMQCLKKVAADLARIPLRVPARRVPRISLTGEIFVRRDSLSRRHLTEWLAERGFATICTPISEWMHYCDYLLSRGISNGKMTRTERLRFHVKKTIMARLERRIKKLISASGLVSDRPVNLPQIIHAAAPYISDRLAGEAVLTVGGAMHEVVSHVCGVIAIGPFGCMPNRLSEAILNETMNRRDKLLIEGDDRRLRKVLEDVEDLPFLAVESDGSPFPQLIHAKLETFCLRAERLHRRMLDGR